MLTYKRLIRKPRTFRSMTGLNIDEFEYNFARTEAKRLPHPYRQPARGARGPFKHDLRTRLMMTLA